jgi:type III restriction enzyme
MSALFQYDQQPYQEDCIRNILSVFGELHSGNGLRNVAAKYEELYNYPKSISDRRNLDILMETETGKTFTYIKTMFELHNHFNYNKFIILVPSVAIREGTKINFEDTAAYFRAYYANERTKEIKYYIYEAENL